VAKKRLAGQPQRAGERPPAGTPTSDDASSASAASTSEAQEAASSAGASPAPDVSADQVEKDLDELETVQRERDEYLELAQRTRADFDNYRKRVAKETSEALNRGKAELARELIPVVDNLERALQSATASRPQPQDGTAGEAGEPPSDALAHGVGLVLDELRSKLVDAGIETYDPTGERFDPELHEALSTRPEEGTDPGLVLETVEKGYRLNGQVLRPARVVVSK
jgi:molecular chaperone GrpE